MASWQKWFPLLLIALSVPVLGCAGSWLAKSTSNFLGRTDKPEDSVWAVDRGASEPNRESRRKLRPLDKAKSIVDATFPSKGSALEGQLAVARLSERRGQQKLAAQLYHQLIEKYPDQPLPHHRLAVLAARRGKFRLAERHFRAAMRIAQPSVDLLSDMGFAFYLEDRMHEAEQLLRQALEQEPSHAAARRSQDTWNPHESNKQPGHPEAGGEVVPVNWVSDALPDSSHEGKSEEAKDGTEVQAMVGDQESIARWDPGAASSQTRYNMLRPSQQEAGSLPRPALVISDVNQGVTNRPIIPPPPIQAIQKGHVAEAASNTQAAMRIGHTQSQPNARQDLVVNQENRRQLAPSTSTGANPLRMPLPTTVREFQTAVAPSASDDDGASQQAQSNTSVALKRARDEVLVSDKAAMHGPGKSPTADEASAPSDKPAQGKPNQRAVFAQRLRHIREVLIGKPLPAPTRNDE